jgi:sulfur carrier protein
MKIIVNGEDRDIDDNLTVDALILVLGIKVKVMAIAVNMDIVKKEDWNTHLIKENDKIELLHFVGGG